MNTILFVTLAIASGVLIVRAVERVRYPRQYGHVGGLGPMFVAIILWFVSWIPIIAIIEWLT